MFSSKRNQTHATSSMYLSVLYNLFYEMFCMCFTTQAEVIVNDLCEQVYISLDSQV